MSLRWKIILLLGLVFSLYLGATRLIQETVLLPSFVALERDEAAEDVNRCASALRGEIRHLLLFCGDWSGWDEAYAFVQGKDPAFIERNMMLTTFSSNQLNMICISDPGGQILWQQAYNLPSMHPMQLAAFSGPRLPADSPLVSHVSPDSESSGMMLTERGPMIVVSRPIITSNHTGPVRGAMIMGRLLTERKVQELSERARVNMRVWAIDGNELPAYPAQALAELRGGAPIAVQVESEGRLGVYATFPDITGAPALLLRADIPRVIFARGQGLMRFALVSDIAAATAILLLTWAALQRIVVKPISRLTAHVLRVGTHGDLRARLAIKARDEIGSLAREFDRMVERLADSNSRHLEAAHRAGVAETAAGVLHNVGNALTSVGVSTELLGERLRDSKAADLQQATQLLAEEDALLDAERRRLVSTYLGRLAQAMIDENAQNLEEIRRVQDKVSHIEHAIRAQQRNVVGTAYAEETSLCDLVAEVLDPMEDEFRRQGIRVTRELAGAPRLQLNPHALRQVLVSLVQNAMDAVRSRENPRIDLRVRSEGSNIVLEVADNGEGIEPSLQRRVFEDGFTTKGAGHGFGLHFCGNAVRRMGGRIELASEGPGKGATVRLMFAAPVAEVPA